MNKLRVHIDVETRSSANLPKCGAPIYASDPSTDVTVLRAGISEETETSFKIPTKIEDTYEWRRGDRPHDDLRNLIEKGTECRGWNSIGFEEKIFRYILGPRYGWPVPKPEQWRDTMEEAREHALPASLEWACKAALGPDVRKNTQGHALMMKMCKPTGYDEAGQPIYRESLEDFDQLSNYCAQDVIAEATLMSLLPRMTDYETQGSRMTQRMNDRGIAIDLDLVRAMQPMANRAMMEANKTLQKLTSGRVGALTNHQAITRWLNDTFELNIKSIAKEAVQDMLSGESEDTGLLPELAEQVLRLRMEGGKTSLSKIGTALLATSSDGRLRDQFVWCGASRTKRFSAHGLQLHNVIREILPPVIINLIKTGQYELIKSIWGAMSGALSESLRHMLIAPPGRRLYGGDFSQVESRLTAFMAGDEEKLDHFRAGEDLYRVQGARMFGTRPDEITDNQRQASKTTELACVFGGGWGALTRMSRKFQIKLSEEEAREQVTLWRSANRKTQRAWYATGDAAEAAIKNLNTTQVADKISFFAESREDFVDLYMETPSGTVLRYPEIEVTGPNEFGGNDITFMNAKGRSWYRRKIYGAGWFQAATQSAARDLIVPAMIDMEDAGYLPVATIHDEALAETPEGFGSLEEFEGFFTKPRSWTEGLPLAAKCWCAKRYQK